MKILLCVSPRFPSRRLFRMAMQRINFCGEKEIDVYCMPSMFGDIEDILRELGIKANRQDVGIREFFVVLRSREYDRQILTRDIASEVSKRCFTRTKIHQDCIDFSEENLNGFVMYTKCKDRSGKCHCDGKPYQPDMYVQRNAALI